jgi:peptide/nickel transport system ATP-binding protein
VTVQAQILALIGRLREELGMALVIVTHDLGVIAQTAEQVAVMYAGRIVERAPTATIFEEPEHPYTWGLLRSIPRLDLPRDVPLVPIEGRPPSLLQRPSGCSFHPRCPHVREPHRRIDPPLEPAGGDPAHEVACLLPQQTRRELWAQVREGR